MVVDNIQKRIEGCGDGSGGGGESRDDQSLTADGRECGADGT